MDVAKPSPTTAAVFSEPVDESSIRLLRFSQPEDGVIVGKLQKFPLVSAPHYYTASYVWGERDYTGAAIHLKSGKLPILSSLVPFIRMVTHHSDFKSTDWWWIDSLCINLQDSREREKQVRIMADIYKKARRAIIWLGEEKEDGSDCTNAIDFFHYLSTLQIAFNGDDLAMRKTLENTEFTEKCVAISNLLARPWWTRVWTLQEFVLPPEAKFYCGASSISRGRFKSAIYSIFLCSTISTEFEHELVPRKLFDGAFNRRRIHQWHTKPASVGINLIADRKSTRLNSSHMSISYAVFCLKKKKKKLIANRGIERVRADEGLVSRTRCRARGRATGVSHGRKRASHSAADVLPRGRLGSDQL